MTRTPPVLARLGTGPTMFVAVRLVGVAVAPPNGTVLVPCVAPKFAPVIVTAAPTGPEAGFMLVMLGGATTVKLTPLLATPATVTTTFPVVAPAGTGATMLVLLQLVGVAGVPLNVTVLPPCAPPKFVPPILTDVPAPPDVGDRLVMLGPVLPTLDALNAAMFAIQPRPEGESVQVTATDPAVPCISSSSAYPAALPRSTRFVKLLPAVNVSPLPAESSTPQPNIKSPFAVVVADPLEGLLPLPVAPAVRSKAEEVTTPLYS